MLLSEFSLSLFCTAHRGKQVDWRLLFAGLLPNLVVGSDLAMAAMTGTYRIRSYCVKITLTLHKKDGERLSYSIEQKKMA
jgi:hypothetical protein